jgi:hypothetical protein
MYREIIICLLSYRDRYHSEVRDINPRPKAAG